MSGGQEPEANGAAPQKTCKERRFPAAQEKYMELSKRMSAVAQMVPAGHITADVGCDHGFVSIYLIEHGICPHVYAADVRPGPLARAKQHIEESRLAAYITPVLSDGLKAVPVGKTTDYRKAEEKNGLTVRQNADGNADAAEVVNADAAENADKEAAGGADVDAAEGADVMIAAGMGGKLTIRILSDVPEKTKQLSYLILEPQSEVWLVRRWLFENGFVIVDEDMVWEEGKFYPVIRAKNSRCEKAVDEKQDCAVADGSEACWEKKCGAQTDDELVGAQRRQEMLCRKMEVAGISKARQRAACECFGPVLISKKSAVLLSFLEHTIEKDGGLLQEMPQACSEPEKAERIRRRREELEERIALAGQIAEMLRKEP